jgi:hypothetical protein
MPPTLPAVTDVRRPFRSWSPWCTPRRALLALVCLAQGCLVTTDVNYSRPNTPPHLGKEDPRDFAAVVSDCTDRDSMTFLVTVYDADVEDDVFIRVLVDGNEDRTLSTSQTGKPDRDPVPFCVPINALDQECTHVEIIASNTFNDLDSFGTLDMPDMAHVEWWLVGPTGEYPEVGVQACQKKQEEEQ